MINMYKTLTTFVTINILLDFIIQAIIVERNLYSYYRLPTSTVRTSNDSEDYYILQCPFKSSPIIPKPKDMPVCLIVGRHSANDKKQKELVKAKTRTVLNTQVDYRYLKPPKLVKLVKMKNGKPCAILLKPINTKEVVRQKPKIETPNQYKAINMKFMIPNHQMIKNQTTVLYSVPLVQKMPLNDSLALSSKKEPQKLAEPSKASAALEADFSDDPLDEEDSQTSPLKYLGVQDTLKELKLTQQLPHPSAPANQTVYKSEKFFADSENYKKGFRSKGFQNMYHRDEVYQDHIFYDDLQQMGNYRINQKFQQKQP